MNRKTSATTPSVKWQRAIAPLALLSLLVAWWVGYQQQVGISHILRTHFSLSTLTQEAGHDHRFHDAAQNSRTPYYAASANGYGGPLVMAFEVDAQHRIRHATLVDHVDTAGYVVNVLNQRMLDRINGKPITSAMMIGNDIDGVSGATLTVAGMTEAVRKAAHEEAIARGLTPDTVNVPIRFQLTDALLTILVLMVLFERKLPAAVRKYHIMLVGVLSVVVIGFWANMALSLASLSSLLLGYWPDPRQNPSLYILLLAIVVGMVWLGKNVYCSQLCPFHHIQRWLHKLGKNNVPLPRWLTRHAVNIVNVLLWAALMLMFVSRNPAIASYEPFSMLFSLDGVGVQWYILPLALTGSFFIKDYWCRLLCPLGRALNVAVEQRQTVRKTWRIWQKKRGSVQQRDVS
ncbi:FMN-binding protein [Photobacterium japonica]|uniref:FMN-binding protein n=1 Tax=Photobacterium japonica TaxID=2910235 RepID=UPI003D0E86EA